MTDIHINYRQMLAAKQVYHDTYEDLVYAVYKECGSSGVVSILQHGAQLIVKCVQNGKLTRLADRESIIVRFEDILSVIVVTSSNSFVIDQLHDDVLVTILSKSCNGPMGALLLNTHTYGLDHLRITGISVPVRLKTEVRS